MAKPKQIILTEEGVITQEALAAYAAGKLSPAEIVEMEKLLKGDPFAQEALEGMRHPSAPAEMKSVVVSLNTQLREKTGARESKKKGIEIHWATYAYAAMIVGILIGLGFVMVHFIDQKDQQIAMNKNTAQAVDSTPLIGEKPQAPLPITDSPIAVAANTTTLSGSYNDTVSVRPANGLAMYNTTTDADKEKGSSQQGFIAAAPTAADKKAMTPVATTSAKADQQLKVTASAAGAAAPAKQPETKTAEAKKEQERGRLEEKNAETVTNTAAKTRAAEAKDDKVINQKPLDNSKAARALFDAGDYKLAAKKYNDILKDEPDNADALYFGGVSDYFNGKGRQAEKNFDKLLKANLFVEGSKWYKANVLIDKGKKDDAKQLLRDLINTNSSYKDRAVKKYEEIVK